MQGGAGGTHGASGSDDLDATIAALEAELEEEREATERSFENAERSIASDRVEREATVADPSGDDPDESADPWEGIDEEIPAPEALPPAAPLPEVREETLEQARKEIEDDAERRIEFRTEAEVAAARLEMEELVREQAAANLAERIRGDQSSGRTTRFPGIAGKTGSDRATLSR